MEAQPLVPNKAQYDALKDIFTEVAFGKSTISDFNDFLYGWFFAKSRSAEVAEVSLNAFQATIDAWEEEIFGEAQEVPDEN